MKARLMRHNGISSITVPAVKSSYFDPDLGDNVEEIVTPERQIEYKLPPGTKFGGYPTGVEVLVPRHMQGPLYDKGFEFVKPGDKDAFQKEREVAIKERQRREQAAKAQKAETQPPPVSDPPVNTEGSDGEDPMEGGSH
jgi:hypothetical protein